MGHFLSKVSPLGPGKAGPVELTPNNIDEFMRTFDTLISDCDGVIWTPHSVLPKSFDGLRSIKAAGKKVLFASNNSVLDPFPKFEKFGFSVQKEEIVHPAIALAMHLENIGFKRKAFVIGVEHFKKHLREKGVEVVPDRTASSPEYYPEDLGYVLSQIKPNNGEIGAVVVDIDVNTNYLMITQATNFLRSNKECLFFAGATDDGIVIPDGRVLLGSSFYLRAIEEMSGRKAELMGKPADMMVNYLRDLHNLDLSRTVFVGDSLTQDMGVANACGMIKLLVLTGTAKLEDLKTCAPELVPDYYIKSIADFADLLNPPENK